MYFLSFFSFPHSVGTQHRAWNYCSASPEEDDKSNQGSISSNLLTRQRVRFQEPLLLEDEASDDPGVIGLVRGQSRHQQVTRSGNSPDRRRHPLVERVEPKFFSIPLVWLHKCGLIPAFVKWNIMPMLLKCFLLQSCITRTRRPQSIISSLCLLPPASATDKTQQHQNHYLKNLRTLRIEPGAAEWKVQTLPLLYTAPAFERFQCSSEIFCSIHAY